jgi:hypothetical protein
LGSHALVFNDDEIRVLLKAAIEREGSQFAFARHHGVNRTHINMVLKGKKSRVQPLRTLLDFAK